MSLGKMNSTLTILKKVYSTDDEAFKTTTEEVVTTTRCYREQRHGSLKWANYASFSEATDLFRFRLNKNVTINLDLIFECDNLRFIPISLEYVRGMYIEALAKRVEATSG